MCGSTLTQVGAGIATGGISTVAGAIGDAMQAPGAPQLPQYPAMTPQETALLQGQQNNLSQYGNMTQGVAGQLQNNQSILQQISGLFNSDGSINQQALTQLQQTAKQGYQTAGQGGQNALQSASGIFGQGGALQSTEAQYQNALQGNAPANQALQYQQNQNFMQMQQQAAQQGIKITGNNWANAVSDSTAGQKLIQNYQQNSNMQNQQYQLGYLGQLGTNMGQLAGAGTSTATTGMGLNQYATGMPAQYAGQSISQGQGALAPYLQQYNQMSQSMYQPYYMQQIGPYQQQMAQAQANYQAQNNQYQGNMGMLGGLMNLGGQLGGAAIMA